MLDYEKTKKINDAVENWAADTLPKFSADKIHELNRHGTEFYKEFFGSTMQYHVLRDMINSTSDQNELLEITLAAKYRLIDLIEAADD